MNSNTPKTIAVIGAGPMGLICAYRLLQKGHKVSLFERDDRIGGMSASFDFDGLRIEKFYHFITMGDAPTMAALQEFGVADKLKWKETKMGFYYEGKLYPWGDPLALLRFPKLDIISKIRYAAHIFYSKNMKNWHRLDQKNAVEWLQRWLGKKGYKMLWETLLRYKYYEFNSDISAAWIASRIRRIAHSRKNIFTEELGYLEGGTETLLDKMAERIKALGGEIVLRANVTEVCVSDNKVRGVKIDGEEKPFDTVISTIPLPYVPCMVPALSPDSLARISAVNNIGMVCVILKLKQRLSNKFWTNINDPRMEIPGIIEYTNLYPSSDAVVYIPYYMPASHAKYAQSDEQFLDEVTRYLALFNPAFSKEWIKATYVSRYAFAQPVCTQNFLHALPPMQSGIEGFIMADTAYYYPEDRSICESIKLGDTLASMV